MYLGVINLSESHKATSLDQSCLPCTFLQLVILFYVIIYHTTHIQMIHSFSTFLSGMADAKCSTEMCVDDVKIWMQLIF